MKFFSPVRQKVFKKSVILPPMHQNFLYQIFFEMQKGSPTSFLGVLRHKEFFDRNVMSPRPPPPAILCKTVFDTRSFLKYRCVPLRDLSLVWKKSSTVNGEILFWCKNFSIPEIFWNTERLHDEVYRYYETQKESEKPVMLPRPTMREKPSIREFSRIRERLSYDFLRFHETKNFRRKIVIPPYYAWNFSIPESFWNTEVFPNVFFNYYESKIIDKTVMPSPSYPW